MRTSRAAGGVALSTIAGLASLAAGIVLLPFIISSVGAESYGVWLVLSAVASYFYYSDVGVGAAITHFGARARGGQKGPSLSELLACGLVWSGIAAVIVAPIYLLFSWWYVGALSGSLLSDGDQCALVLLSFGLLVPLIVRPFGSALVGAGYLTIERRNQVAGVIVRTVGTLGACAADLGIIAIAAVELVALLTPSLLAIGSLRRRHLVQYQRANVSIVTLRQMLTFSYKSFGVSFVGALTLQSGMIILGLVGSPAEVTYYNAAFRIYSSVRQVLAWTVDPFRPALSRLFARGRGEAAPVLMSILLISLGVGTVTCTALIIASPDLISLWLGDTVPGVAVALAAQILLLGLLLNLIHIPLAPATDAAGKPGVLFPGQILWLLLTVAFSVPLSMEFGIVGTALGISLPLVIIEPVMLWLAMRALGIRLGDWVKAVARPVLIILLVAGIPALCVMIIVRPIGTPGMHLVVAVVFGAASLVATAVLERKYKLRSIVRNLNVEL